ncbi:hypothetical protein TWF730_011368 [Orbilia blumenaviensis]|uniref:F-box domain-containing protein n=1 Tax=Orbilia blumenaviensis TaxID=1796055 RepID=A0AAV9VEB4_9PEZI
MTLFYLPTEIHIEILSHLEELNDHEAASQSFPLWRDILATSFLGVRYPTTSITDNGLRIHGYLSLGIPLVVTISSRETGVITGWQSLYKRRGMDLGCKDISMSVFLDDPFFLPRHGAAGSSNSAVEVDVRLRVVQNRCEEVVPWRQYSLKGSTSRGLATVRDVATSVVNDMLPLLEGKVGEGEQFKLQIWGVWGRSMADKRPEWILRLLELMLE